jgi:hypothetical protein
MNQYIKPNIQFSRIKLKSLDTGVPFTLPNVPTGTTEEQYLVSGNFLTTDLLDCELGVEKVSKSLWLRIDNEIITFENSSGDTYTTGTTVVGNTIYFDTTDTLSAYTADLSSIVSGLTLASGNGITIGTGNTIDLGGLLTQPTVISGNSQTFDLGVTGSELDFYKIKALQASEEYKFLGQGLEVNKNPGGFFTDVDYTSTIGVRSLIEQTPYVVSSVVISDSGDTQTQITQSNLQINILTRTNGGPDSGFALDQIGDSFRFTDNRVTARGLEYQDDYSTNFSIRSLVDKAYVDNAITGITDNNYYTTGTTLVGNTIYFNRNDTLSAYTADLTSIISGATLTSGNGITISSGNTIDLGGTLNQPTVISGSSQTFDLGTSDSQLSFFRVNSIQGFEEYSVPGYILTNQQNPGGITSVVSNDTGMGAQSDLHPGNFVFQAIGDSGDTYTNLYADNTQGGIISNDLINNSSSYINFNNNGSLSLGVQGSGSTNISGLDLDDTAGGNGLRFIDGRANGAGLEYDADYSTNFTNRSLVDKEFVDNAITSGATFSGGSGNCISDLYVTNIYGCSPITVKDELIIESGITGTGNIDISGNVISDIVQLRGGVGTQGEMSWSADEETVQLIMDGTTLYMGQDTFVHVRNNTASIITKGTAVYATGTLGASGRITVAPMIANGTIPGRLFIGLAAENIAISEDGQVITFGKIRNINTTAYNDGDVLWISPTVAGQLTATEPVAPNLKIATAFVVHDANNGTLMVRAEQGTDLHSDRRVQVSGLTNNDVLTWNGTNNRWQNVQPVDTNFANTNLTLTASRTHQLNNFDLVFANGALTTDRALIINSFKDVFTRGKGDQNNLVLGFNTGRAITTANNNVVLGDLAGQNMSTTANAVLIGRNAGNAIVSANQTVAIGRGALEKITASSDNTAIGSFALSNITGTQFNTALGSDAGSTLTNGGSNVFIGRNTQPLTTTDNSSIVIGTNAVGYGGGTAVLGNSSVTLTRLRGRVEMNQITAQPTITDNSSYAMWFNGNVPTIRLKNNVGVESNIPLQSTTDAITKTSAIFNRTLTLEAPTSSDDITIFRTDVAITVQEVIAVSVGTTPSTTYQLKFSTDRDAAGTNLTTSAATTSKTTGDIATLSTAAIPANSWIWLETTAASGTGVRLTVDIRYTID